MSRYYGMSVRIVGAVPGRVDAVKQATEAEWPFDEWFLDGEGVLTASAEDRLCGGETDAEFAQRLTQAIWAANGGSCRVEVNATYLEDLPCETYCFDQDEYRRLSARPVDEPPTREGDGDG